MGPSTTGNAGTANTGGGGGGVGSPSSGIISTGGTGGSGVVVIRSPAGAPLSVAPCTNTVSCVGGATVARFTVSGTLTVN
jgi:hypothetical protein